MFGSKKPEAFIKLFLVLLDSLLRLCFPEKSLLPEALAGSQWHWPGPGPSQCVQGSLQPGRLEPGVQPGRLVGRRLPLPRRPLLRQGDGGG